MAAWSERHLKVGDAGTFLDEQWPLPGPPPFILLKSDENFRINSPRKGTHGCRIRGIERTLPCENTY
jgi:hypothetical protein